MKIVSSQTDEEIRRKDAADEMERTICRLASNMLRVVRGSGKGNNLLREMQACLKAAEEYYDAHGHWPPSHLYNKWLNWESEEAKLPYDDRSEWAINRDDAHSMIGRGVLQIIASRIAEQPLQIAAGERELREGIDYLERISEARRRELQRKLRGQPHVGKWSIRKRPPNERE